VNGQISRIEARNLSLVRLGPPVRGDQVIGIEVTRGRDDERVRELQ